MITKSKDQLHRIVERILLAAGASPANAAEVTAHLVLANLSGVDSHGIWHVIGYVQRIQEGELDPAATPEVLKETPTSTLVSGHWTFGHVAARFTLEKAIDKAKEQNVAVGGLVQSNHIGRLGHFVELATAQGMVSMVCLGGLGTQNPSAVPYGGRQTLMHTNPIAMGFPGHNGQPAMMFDFATTAMAGAKVVTARDRGQTIPPMCLVDKDGNPTTDPNALFEGGGHLPFGAHKGYAIMMAIDYLSRVFLNTDAFVEENRGWLYDRYAGTFILVFKADLFHSLASFAELGENVAAQARAVDPAPGFDEVLAPGDLETRTRQERGRDGIPIAEDIWQTLVQAGALVGVDDIDA